MTLTNDRKRTMSLISERISALQAALPDLTWITSPMQIKRLSRDFNWFSPVLKRQLEDKLADIAVSPRTEMELRRLVSSCAKASVPITLRGGGTGNYGQSVPLHGGVLIDMSQYQQFLWIKNGVVRAQAGIKLAALEEQLAPHGWEMRCLPSTFQTATLGGLFCGGFGGIGSISYGPLAAPGTVLGVRIMSMEQEPRIIELRAPEAMLHAHTYGTNGIILELEFALAPAQRWQEYLLSFPGHESAFEFASTLANAPGINKRNVALFSDMVAANFSRLAPQLVDQQGRPQHAVIAVVPAQSHEVLQQMSQSHGGRIVWSQTNDQAKAEHHTLLEYCWNHATLHNLRGEKNITYLQTAYTYGMEREQLATIAREAGDEVLSHLEFIRDMQGRITCVGLPVIRFSNEERLQQLIQLHRAHGIKVNDPHVYTLEDGKHGGSLSPDILASKRRFDPAGLLNPGKIRSLQ